MARIVVAPSADADTDAILTDLAARAGIGVAIRYDGLFDALYRRLAIYPAIGAPRPQLGADIRIGIVTLYHVIYRHVPGGDLVEVLRIIHGRRRLVRRFLTPTA